ncbi:hypothetical protein B484DRAFT_451640 [Ochromonadaceae sp. CCMP2298]|nr:hypothetical protein B484DRAFT_451640 [Ochromonadaceae sp. CCMP2298]
MLRNMEDLTRRLGPDASRLGLLELITAGLNSNSPRSAPLASPGLSDVGTSTTGTGEEETLPGPTPEEQLFSDPLVQTELARVGLRLQMVLPFMAILMLKIMVDNFVSGVAVTVVVVCFIKLKYLFEGQLSLKDRSSRPVMLALLVCSSILCYGTLCYANTITHAGGVLERLTLRYPKDDASFFSLIWSCLVTDGVIQIMALTAKLLLVNIMDAAAVDCSKLSRQCRVGEGGAGGAACPRDAASSGPARSAFVALSSRLGLTELTGLVRRQVSGGGGSGSGANSGASSDVEEGGGAGNALGGWTEDTEVTDERVSRDYLLRLRVFTLVDILALVYRTLTPLPLWSRYFEAGPLFGTAFGVAYLCAKIIDLIWKSKGALKALRLFLSNSIEFGRYADEPGQNEECPICMELPSRPVTLDCNHAFCEVCISEWLNKEHTCPVCRAQVHCCSTSLGAVKRDAVNAFPIVF